MTILITGSNGFVGAHLAPALIQQNYSLKPINRSTFDGITPVTDWSKPLAEGIDTVIHLAARVHLMQDSSADPLTTYRATNTESTLNLAQQAADSGVRRFIFLSSIKVNGEGRNTPYTEQDIPAPIDPYAISKWEAEQGLLEISAKTGMEVVIIRPPLIYGAGVKANFLRLLQWIEKGRPLPFGNISNRRSLLYIGNLVDAIRICIEHPAAANQVFLLSDNESISTTELSLKLSKYFKYSPRLLNLPPHLLKIALMFIGKKQTADRLLGSLSINNRKICQSLNWKPPFTLDEGLSETVKAYSQTKNG